MKLEDLPGVTYHKVHQSIFRKDRHSSSALFTTEIEYMLKYQDNNKALKREHRELLAKLKERNASHLPCGDFIPWFMRNLASFGVTNEAITFLTTALKVAKACIKDIINRLHRSRKTNTSICDK